MFQKNTFSLRKNKSVKNLVPVLSGLVMVSGLVIGPATVHADDNINSENNAAITYGGLSSSSGSSASTDNTLNTSVAQDVEEVPSDSTGSITDSTGGNITETNSSTPSTDSAPMYTFDGEGTDVYRHTVNNLISDQGTVDVTPVEYINDVDDENATFKYDMTFAPVQSSNHIETVNGLVIAVPEHATNLTVQVLGYASKTGEVVRLETPITLDNADETAAREAYANGETYEYPEENGYTGALVYKGLSTDPESAAEITPEARVKYYGLAPSYSFFEKELRTLALAVSYDVPTEIAKKQPYQPIYTSALAWKLNEEGSFGSYEEGGLSLQEYSWAQDPDALSYVQDPSKIGPNDFDRDGLKSQKDVGVTAYTGEFAIVGQDVTVPTESIIADDGTILTNNYVSTFNLRSNVGVDYYISETEDMADITVSTYKVNNLIEDQGSVDVTPLFVENEADADKALYSYQVSFAPVQSSNKIETNGSLMFAIPENATEVTVELLGYVKKSGEVVTFEQPMTVQVTTEALEGLDDNGYTSQVFKMTGPETNVSNDSVINEIPNVQYYGLAPSYTFYENDLRTLGFNTSYKIPTEEAVATPN